MGISRNFFKEYNFMLTKLVGDISGRMLFQHVINLNRETQGISDLKELADCRNVTNIKGMATQMAAVSARSEENKPGSNLAILIEKDANVIYGLANVYRVFAEESRESVKLFRDLQEALNWLSDSDLEAEALNALVNGVS